MFLGHVAKPLKNAGDALWFFESWPQKFPEPKRPFKTKRDIHTVYVSLGSVPDRHGRWAHELYDPKVSEMIRAVDRLLDGPVKVERIPHPFVRRRVGGPVKISEPLFKITTEDRMARSRLSGRIGMGGVEFLADVVEERHIVWDAV
jgi:hypothetical protein